MSELEMRRFLEETKSPQLRKALEDFRHKADDPLHRAFLTRALHAVTAIVASLNDDLLSEATSHGTDLEVLIAALNALPELPLNETDSAWLQAKLRGIEAKRGLLEAEGGAASSAELADLLKLTRQAVDKRRKNGQLLALETSGRGYRYPLWQVVNGASLYGLQQILDELSEHDPWMALQFFLRENMRLEQKRPLDVLRKRDPAGLEKVRMAAHSYGTHGAD